MRVSPHQLVEAALCTIIGLLLLAPAGADAQEHAAAPSLHPSVSAGFAIGTLGYRVGALEMVGEVEPGGLLSARLLVGSRPEVLCPSEDMAPGCGERSAFVALLGGVQWVPFGNVVEPYLGGQAGVYHFAGPIAATSGLIAAAQVGVRLRLGSLGGVYGDASYMMIKGGGFPITGMGLYFHLRPLR